MNAEAAHVCKVHRRTGVTRGHGGKLDRRCKGVETRCVCRVSLASLLMLCLEFAQVLPMLAGETERIAPQTAPPDRKLPIVQNPMRPLSQEEAGMNAIIAKSSGVFGAILAFPGATVRLLLRAPEALAEAIEKHAIGK